MSEKVLQNATEVESLPVRMRAAADTLVEATIRWKTERDSSLASTPDTTSWDAANLWSVATRWENEDREAAEREAKEALTRELADAIRDRAGSNALAMAHALIEAGWTKKEND